MKHLYIIPVLFAVLLSANTGCTIKYYDTNKLLNDYTTEGFLDTDHYQVIITGVPERSARGLVASRESALKAAKADMNSRIISSLTNYNLNHNMRLLKIKDINDILNFEEAKKYTEGKMQELMQYGYTAFEYYKEDYSAVIVYRLFKDDLIKDIESVKLPFKLKDAKTGEKKTQ